MAHASPLPSPAAKPSCRRVLLLRGVLGLILVLLGWGAFILATAGQNDAPADAEQQTPGPQEPSAAQRDRDLARQVLGQWHDEYMSTKRTMTLRADGRGEMLVEVSGMGAVLFASRLRFDMEWSVRDGRLVQHSLGGEPEGKVRALLKMMGDRADQPILEVTVDRLLLLHEDGKTRLDWRRTP